MNFSEIFSVIDGANLSLPVIEVTGLMVVVSLCLVFRYNRIGLIAAYLVAYRWGWMFVSSDYQQARIPYIWFGGAVTVLSIFSMVRDNLIGEK